jgi:hypothetical protein
VNLLSTKGKLFRKVLKIFQRHVEELLIASQLVSTQYIMLLQCIRVADWAASYFSNTILTAVVLLDTEKPSIQHGMLAG